MHKVILHVGYPKTATTWFQNNFYPYVENFRYVERELFNSLFFSRDVLAIKKYLTDCEKDIVICDEALLITKKHKLSILEKAERLRMNFSSPKIIIFIRNQLDIIESVYSQWLRGEMKKNINDFIVDVILPKKKEQWDYYVQINTYISVFKKENVYVYLYEDFQMNQEKFIEKYARDLYIELDIEHLKFTPVNVRTNPFFVPLVLGYNNIFKNKFYDFKMLLFYRFNQKIKNLIFKQKTHHYFIKNDVKKLLIDYYCESNQKLISEFGLNLEKYNYPL